MPQACSSARVCVNVGKTTDGHTDRSRGIEYRVWSKRLDWKPVDILLHIGCRLRLLAALTSQRSSPCTAASPTVSVPGSPATALCIGNEQTLQRSASRCNRCRGLGHVVNGLCLIVYSPSPVEKIVMGRPDNEVT